MEAMIIDAHTHLGEANGKNLSEDDLLQSMDKAGIDYSIVLAERVYGGKFSQIEHILKVSKKTPRIKAVIDCDFTELDIEQINRITELLETNEVVGVKFYLGYDKYYPTNEKLFPIYEYCQKNGKPVIFHTGMLEAGNSGLLKYAHPLLIDEVSHLFPKLKVVMAHMGNPWLLDCAAVLAKNKYVYADVSAFFEEYKPISHDDVAIFVQRMKDIQLFLGSYNKFIFGTDWPLYDQAEYIQAVNALELSPQEKENVFWKNAASVFNLSIDR